MSSLKEIEERQKRMYELIDRMVAEEDMTAMLLIVQQLENEAKLLEAAAVAFEAKMEKEIGKRSTSTFEVVLTPEQRQRIYKASGVQMSTVVIEDTSGVIHSAMPTTAPERIEEIALGQAMAKKRTEEAQAQARAETERALAEIEAQGELYAEQVAKLREDPEFRKRMGLDKK